MTNGEVLQAINIMRVKNIASPLVSVMSNRMLQSFYYVEFNYGYKKKTPLAGGYFTILRDIHVAPQLKTVLVLALKFCLQPTLQPPELTGLPRKMTCKINKKIQSRCIVHAMSLNMSTLFEGPIFTLYIHTILVLLFSFWTIITFQFRRLIRNDPTF